MYGETKEELEELFRFQKATDYEAMMRCLDALAEEFAFLSVYPMGTSGRTTAWNG